MYKIISGGQIVGYSETIVYIKLHGNGCYVPRENGWKALRRPTVEIDTKTTPKPPCRQVHALTDGGLSGTEPEAKLK